MNRGADILRPKVMPGEPAAQTCLDMFLGRMSDYSTLRDRLDTEGQVNEPPSEVTASQESVVHLGN